MPNASMARKRYLNAWSRYHRSDGFGIHSPFAFLFVVNVWSQPLHYYAYESITRLRNTVKGMYRQQRNGIDLISEREARLLFRVTNYFNPQRILLVGAATGVEGVTMLAVNSKSRLVLCDAHWEQNPIAVRVMQSHLDRVVCYGSAAVAVNDFLEDGRENAMALVNVPIDGQLLYRLLDAGIVVVMCRLNRDRAMSALFENCCSHMSMGQTFTNDKIAILNPNPKLQREDFLLWL